MSQLPSSPTAPGTSIADKSVLTMEYEQVNDNFRMLADIRFKLLALIPTLAGAAIYVLSHIAISAQDSIGGTHPDLEKVVYDFGTVALISILGFVATFGITLYDQRNTALYNALIGRAKILEALLGIGDGQFNSRPQRGRRLVGVVAGHDTGLALIYGPVLGAWFFPMVYATLKWRGVTHPLSFSSLQFALFFALGMTLVFIEEFFRLDGGWKKVWSRIRGGNKGFRQEVATAAVCAPKTQNRRS